MAYLGGGAARAGIALACVVGLCAHDALAQSDSAEAPPNPNDAQVHAFISQGFIKSSANNYLSTSARGAFDYTEAAVNVTKNLTDDLRVGAQLFIRDLGPNGTYVPSFDWAYLDYRLRDWLGLRVGRVKIPFGLYNEGSEADQARVPVLLPQAVYPITQQDYLLAQTGGEIYGNLRLGALGALEYRAYGGTLQATVTGAPGITVSSLDVRYVWGGRLTWSLPIDGLQIGGSFQDLRVDVVYSIDPALSGAFEMEHLLPKTFNGTLPYTLLAKLYVASAEYQTGNLLLSSEYSRWAIDLDSDAPALLTPHTLNERYYVMAAYRIAPWFTPGLYYSAYYPNANVRGGPPELPKRLRHKRPLRHQQALDREARGPLHGRDGGPRLHSQRRARPKQAHEGLGRLSRQNDHVFLKAKLFMTRRKLTACHCTARSARRVRPRASARLWALLWVSIATATGVAWGAHASEGQQASFVVVVNAQNAASSLSREFLADAFLKKVLRWDGGDVIRPVDLRADSPVRSSFSAAILRRTVSAVRSYWQQRIFSGGDLPPPEFDSDEAVVRYVAKYPGGIGYVSISAKLGDTKAIVIP